MKFEHPILMIPIPIKITKIIKATTTLITNIIKTPNIPKITTIIKTTKII
jgi:hypothetical protein